MAFDPTEAVIRTDASDPIELGFGQPHYPSASGQKLNDAGTVYVEFYDFDGGDWYLPTEAENNITDRGVLRIGGGFRVPMRIRAVNGARFIFVGEIR